jgi:hypothetical protein
VIATGFGAYRHRRRRPVEVGEEEPSAAEPSSERFELPDDVLEVPSFLRD